MNLLIAESGSTKTEWRLLTDKEITTTFRSPGLNPNVLEPKALEDIVRRAFASEMPAQAIDEVFFYGAGIGSEGQKAIVHDVLQLILPSSRIFVEHDVLAAARSTLRPEGIICILGTGSNSAYHKGHQIQKIIGGHGYIFGDEGSGKDLGLHLLKGILQNDFPDEARNLVEKAKGKSAYDIKIDIHHSETPNVHLAQLAELVGQLTHIPEIEEMVKNRFIAFLDTTVCRYDNYEALYSDFVGSISHYFRPILAEACAARNVKLGTTVKDPITNLIEFHRL